MKFPIKDFFSECDQIHSKQRFWSHLPKKSLMENFIFCADKKTKNNMQLCLFKFLLLGLHLISGIYQKSLNNFEFQH